MGFVAEVCEWYDRYSASWHEISGDFDIAGLHEFDEVFHDDVDAVFMEIAVVSEAEEVEFEAFALDHFLVGNVADDDVSEVRLSCFRA